MASAPRFGGELPAGADIITRTGDDQDDARMRDMLAFSHGRAALGWYLDRNPEIRWVFLCRYTCPTVPAFLSRYALRLRYFDIGASADKITATVRKMDGAGLILVPALFGRDPWLDVADLAHRFGNSVHIIIDAAQTAFGHEDYAAPEPGAVLSCPRKACALGGGAFLRLNKVTDVDRDSVAALPDAAAAAAQKRQARALFRTGDPADESAARDLVHESEKTWPDTPHRMDEVDRALFLTINGQRHRLRRRVNAARLMARMTSIDITFPAVLAGQHGVPFNFPVLLPPAIDRANLLTRLQDRRVFATPLWPVVGGEIGGDARDYPITATYCKRLVALPVDQRFETEDMDEIADRFIACLSN